MHCWRPDPIKPDRKAARWSSNGAASMACAPHWVRSQLLHFCGPACRVRRGEWMPEKACRFRALHLELDLSDEAIADLRYAYKASLIGAAHQFELTGDGLSWRIAGRSGVWPYAGISAIRLSYRPMSMQSRRFRADIENSEGARIAILSTTWQTAALMAPQDRDYRAFIVQLHKRMAKAGSRAALSGGLGANTYAAALVLLALLATAMAGLLVRAIATGEYAG